MKTLTAFELYEETRQRATQGGLRLAVLLSVVMALFPLGCWLVLTWLEPGFARGAAVVPGSPGDVWLMKAASAVSAAVEYPLAAGVPVGGARGMLGFLLLAVSGLAAHGAYVEGHMTARLNEEAERLRWQAQAEGDHPSPAGDGGLHPAGGRGGSGCEAGDGTFWERQITNHQSSNHQPEC